MAEDQPPRWTKEFVDGIRAQARQAVIDKFKDMNIPEELAGPYADKAMAEISDEQLMEGLPPCES